MKDNREKHVVISKSGNKWEFGKNTLWTIVIISECIVNYNGATSHNGTW